MSHHQEKLPASVAASAIGGKTARACDSCVLRRARWYCAADDAFLCHPCDSTVHTANSLARRHERLRLKPSSDVSPASSAPSWYNGFKRKARTPRQHHKQVVPELESSADDEEADDEVEEEKLLYRVPILDPTVAFTGPSPPHAAPLPPQAALVGDHTRVEFTPTELDMAEFAADMESLLGQGLAEGESFSLEELGLMDERESGGSGEAAVKREVEEDWKGPRLSFEMEVDLSSRETLDLDFGCGLPETVEEATALETKEEEGVTSGMGLRLNYEEVMTAWSVRGRSPWISDQRPWVGAEECWLECMQGMRGGVGEGIQAMNAGREARVTRYREKRRTRLFSKKIRYEVRKLNAEKRPRMKGRFVKRSTFTATAAAVGRGGSGSGGGSVAVGC